MIARLIVGSGRSGTTWLLDALAEANGLRAVFEPLNPSGFPEARRYADRHLPADAAAPELADFLSRALRGELNGLESDCRVRSARLWNLASPRYLAGEWVKLGRYGLRWLRDRKRPPLVKLIRANLMLEWIDRHLDVRTVAVVRHPGGVIASKRRLIGPEWEHEARLAACLADELLVRDRVGSALGLLEGAPSPVIGHTGLWCIENAALLADPVAAGVTVVFYERLLDTDDSEWRRAAAALELPAIPDEAARRRPSQQRAREMKRRSFEAEYAGRWRETFDADEIAEMARVLEAFGVTAYRADDPRPVAA